MKKFFSLIFVVVLTFCLLATTVSAEIYGDFHYEISDILHSKDEIIITQCDSTTTGEIVVPSEIDGHKVFGIDNHAFMGCGSATSIYIEEGILSAGTDSFEACYNLTSIFIPRSFLGFYNSFGNHTNLTIYGYAGTYAEEYANENNVPFVALENAENEFEYGDLLYTISDGEVTIIDCSYNAVEVIIPDTIDGYPVTKIGDEAFFYNDSLTSVSLPESITSIGDYAFYACALSSIDIPSNVVSIGKKAFCDCSNLTSLTIPDKVTSIGDFAFNNSGLVSIDISASVVDLNGSAFYSCNDLTEIVVDDNSTTLSSDDNGILFNKDKTKLICCPNGKELTSYVVPDGVKSIDDYAFALYKTLTSVTLPEGVISIGDFGFYCCTTLDDINFPNSLESIGEQAFVACRKIESYTLPKGMTSIGEYAVGYYYSDGLDRSDITIYGYTDSVVENYATENRIPFVPLDNALSYKGSSLLLDGSIGVKVYVEYNSEIVDKDSMTMEVTFENSDDDTSKTEEVELVIDEESESAYAIVHVCPKDIDI